MKLLALLVLAGCAGERMSVIDAHIHTDFDQKPERSSGIVFSREQLLAEMKASGVEKAVAHTQQDGSGYDETLHAHGVIHCAGIAAGEVDTERLEARLAKKEVRCIKIYLGYVHQFASDAHYQPVYALAKKHGVPVVFHTGDTYSEKGKLKYADPLTVDEVAVDHPDVTFVIAHVGNPWIQSAAEVAYKNPNVVLEGSALLVGDLGKLPRGQIKTYLEDPLVWTFGYIDNPQKLMFGTDWPLTGMKATLEAWKRAIPKAHWRAVFFDNAARVFKLKQQ